MTIKKLNKTFVEITNKRLINNSQLQLYNILEDDNTKEKFWNIFKAYYIKEGVDSSIIYELYTVNNDDWWENIAFEYYRDVTVWWTIPLINNIVNPFEFPEPGEQIYILKPSYLNQLLDEVYTIGEL